MEITTKKVKVLTSKWNKRVFYLALLLLPVISCQVLLGQCLSSVNPVGGTSNLLALEKNSLRLIAFHRFLFSSNYYEGFKKSDFNLVKNAYYNYSGIIAGHGISSKYSFEFEAGYFQNKTQVYNTTPEITMQGNGFSNLVTSLKYGLYTNHVKRLYYSVSGGVKTPFSTTYQKKNGVLLPLELQPTLGSFGLVFQSFLVKENSGYGRRFFLTSRVESHFENQKDYTPGTYIFNSFFYSKHIPEQWIKGDWTAILQLRNEIRTRDINGCCPKESSGGCIFVFSPQVNLSIHKKWNLSLLVDIPVFQYYNGTQLGSGTGANISLARTFNLEKSNDL